MFRDFNYTIRYVILSPHKIFNMCGPEHAGPYEWDDAGLSARRKNAQIYIETKKKFYTELEESILKEGIKNPILVAAGYVPPRKFNMLPPEMKSDSSKILFCHSNGGSRLYIAQRYNIQIPCIVADFIDRFNNPEIKTEQELRSYYKDKPIGIQYWDHGVTIKQII